MVVDFWLSRSGVIHVLILIIFYGFQVTKCKCQVVSLGAGFDTLYWNLKDEGLAPQSYIEIDFPDVTMKKCHNIKSKKPLIEKFQTEGIVLKTIKTTH